ncbi:hypothetical protein HRI_003501900 [Hibiscus trionum]|uniref:RRM domain-containing protein n=1 Tax=Hibiscus trionum TaxID=183268 RepID=A0A9W7IMD3_HIBTR|nr:hypothetical protein HRI_003501900 [Hibiscus trionum]
MRSTPMRVNPRSQEWTVFIDNLSKRVQRSALKELFEFHGKVKRVYIPYRNPRPKYSESTFAFVAFGTKEEQQKAIHHLDRSKVDGRIIRVTTARFRVNHQGNHPPRQQPSGAFPRNFSRSYRDTLMKNTQAEDKLEGKQFQDETKTAEVEKQAEIDIGSKKISPQRTALKHGVCKSQKKFYLQTKELEWLDACMAGVIKEGFDLEFVQRALGNDDIEVTLSKWGIDNETIVIRFISREEMENSINNKKEALYYWFKHLGPLLIDGVPHFYTKVDLEGILLLCWHENFFRNLGERWGIFVEVESETKQKIRLDVASIMIRTPNSTTIPKEFDLVSRGYSYNIKTRLRSQKMDTKNEDREDSNHNLADIWHDSYSDSTGDRRSGKQNFSPTDCSPSGSRKDGEPFEMHPGNWDHPAAFPKDLNGGANYVGNEVFLGLGIREQKATRVESWVDSPEPSRPNVHHTGLAHQAGPPPHTTQSPTRLSNRHPPTGQMLPTQSPLKSTRSTPPQTSQPLSAINR